MKYTPGNVVYCKQGMPQIARCGDFLSNNSSNLQNNNTNELYLENDHIAEGVEIN